MNKPKPRLIGLLVSLAVVLHFLAILAVVTHLDEWMVGRSGWQPILGLLSRYSMVTCHNRNFGFFAPSVTPDWNCKITSIDKFGRTREVPLPRPSHEMELKMYSMMGHFSESDDTMDLFARSWAVYVMNHNPEINSVEIVVTRNSIPSMEEYRAGKRIGVTPYYRTSFKKR